MLVEDLDKLQSKEIDKATEKELNEKVTEDNATVMETNGSSELRIDLSDDVVSEFCNDLPVDDFAVDTELTSSVDRNEGLSVDAASVRESSRSPELNKNAAILACNDEDESNNPEESVKDIPVITCNDEDEFTVSVELIEDLCINDDVRSDSEAPRMIDFRKCLSQSDMTNVTIPAGMGSSIEEGHCRSLENVSCSAAAQLNREPHLAPSPLTVLTELVAPNNSENMLSNSSMCKMVSPPMETIIYKSEVPPISVYKYRPIAVKDYFTVSSNDIASAGKSDTPHCSSGQLAVGKSDIPHCSSGQLASAGKSDIPHCFSGQLASAGKFDVPHCSSGQLASAGKFDVPHSSSDQLTTSSGKSDIPRKTNVNCKNIALKDSNQNIVSSVCNIPPPNQFFTSSGDFNSAHYLPTRPLSQICTPSEGMSLPKSEHLTDTKSSSNLSQSSANISAQISFARSCSRLGLIRKEGIKTSSQLALDGSSTPTVPDCPTPRLIISGSNSMVLGRSFAHRDHDTPLSLCRTPTSAKPWAFQACSSPMVGHPISFSAVNGSGPSTPAIRPSTPGIRLPVDGNL